jgi:hypothetical protein
MAFENLYQRLVEHQIITIKDDTDEDSKYAKNNKQARDMALAQIENILRNATNLMSDIRTGIDVEPWVAEKITLANDYLNTVVEWTAFRVQSDE